MTVGYLFMAVWSVCQGNYVGANIPRSSTGCQNPTLMAPLAIILLLIASQFLTAMLPYRLKICQKSANNLHTVSYTA